MTGGRSVLAVRELAERYGVSASTVSRAINRAAGRPAPPPEPAHVDRATGTRYYDPAEFDPWWRSRPGRGRPTRTTDAED